MGGVVEGAGGRRRQEPAVRRQCARLLGSHLYAWGEEGGRVYATAMLVLSLEAPYRWNNLGR